MTEYKDPPIPNLWAICIDADQLQEMGQAGFLVRKIKVRPVIRYRAAPDSWGEDGLTTRYGQDHSLRYCGTLEDGRNWGLDANQVHLIENCDWLIAKELVIRERGMKVSTDVRIPTKKYKFKVDNVVTSYERHEPLINRLWRTFSREFGQAQTRALDTAMAIWGRRRQDDEDTR